MSDTWSSLADALAGFPALPGARCRGLADVFDEVSDPAITEYARHICTGCGELQACSRWFDNLKLSKRPSGTVAGKVRRGQERGVKDHQPSKGILQ